MATGNTALFRAKAPAVMKKLMTDFDFSVDDAAAVLGNIGGETGGFRYMQEIKPLIAGSLGGWGWCQWTGPRRRAFDAYCERNRLNKASDKANYGFLFVELKGPESAAVPAVKRARTLVDKVKAFERSFERAAKPHYDSRIFWANQAKSAYEQKIAAGPIPDLEPAEPAKPKRPWSLLDALLNAIGAQRRKH
jgi:hypothetical protein